MREDILLSLEYHDLTNAQAEALLKSPGPLADIFKEFEQRETDYMDTVFDTVVCRANAVINVARLLGYEEKEKEKEKENRETPEKEKETANRTDPLL